MSPRSKGRRVRPRRPPVRRPAPPVRRVYQYPISTVTVPVGPRVALLNRSASVDASSLASAAGALSRQVNEHLALPPPFGWGLGLSALRVATVEAPPEPDEWVLLLTDNVDEPGAYGYHDETPSGMPILRVFPLISREDRVPWTITASHELLEALCDPNLDAVLYGGDGRLRALEVCDPVETDTYAIDGVAVSNFVLPAYFGTVDRADKFDFMGTLTRAYDLRPGGYQGFLVPGADGLDWTEEANGEKRAYRKGIRGGARGAARRRSLTRPRRGA